MQLQLTTTKIESSLIKGIDYFKGMLTVALGRSMYTYYKVPMTVVLELLSSDSLGNYFNENIKNSYDFRELQ